MGVIGREEADTQLIFQKRVDPVERSARTASRDLDAVIINHDPESFLAKFCGHLSRRLANEDPRISPAARRDDLHPGSRSLRHEVAELVGRVALGGRRIGRDHDRPGRHLPDAERRPVSDPAAINHATMSTPICTPVLYCRGRLKRRRDCMSLPSSLRRVRESPGILLQSRAVFNRLDDDAGATRRHSKNPSVSPLRKACASGKRRESPTFPTLRKGEGG